MSKPITFCETTKSGAKLVRFNNIEDIFWYDDPRNNPTGTSIKDHDNYDVQAYLKNRYNMTQHKKDIIAKAKHSLKQDKEFLDLVYKAKSAKREFKLNRFSGNLSMAHYASNSDKIFKQGIPGAKKRTLNMAFQVGTFINGDYTDSFVKILKTIFMCQAMGIHLNIDVFDSDRVGINNGNAYVICNIAKSHEKLNLKKILVSSHRSFFNYTLFNGYSGHKEAVQTAIHGFLSGKQIKEDLSQRYDVLGGNLLIKKGEEGYEMLSTIVKIGLKNG